MKRGLMLVAVAAVSVPAMGQQIYKCSDGKGGNTYQQVPCARAAETKTVYRYTPVPDAPRQYQGGPSADFSFSGQVGGAPQRSQGQSYQAQPSGGVIRSTSDLDDRLRHIQSLSGTREGRAQLRRESGYQLPQSAQQPAYDPTQGIGQPTRVLDRSTMQPIQGAIKVAPNRIWDPKTGQYHWTTP